MKKLLTIIGISYVIVACNANAENKENKATTFRIQQNMIDSMQRSIDSMNKVTREQKIIDSVKIATIAGTNKTVTTTQNKKVVVTPAAKNTGTTNTNNNTTTTSSTTKKKKMSSTAKGAIIGAGVGAVTGVAVSKNKAKGAVIGAVAGAAVGATTGAIIDKKKKKHSSQ